MVHLVRLVKSLLEGVRSRQAHVGELLEESVAIQKALRRFQAQERASRVEGDEPGRHVSRLHDLRAADLPIQAEAQARTDANGAKKRRRGQDTARDRHASYQHRSLSSGTRHAPESATQAVTVALERFAALGARHKPSADRVLEGRSRGRQLTPARVGRRRTGPDSGPDPATHACQGATGRASAIFPPRTSSGCSASRKGFCRATDVLEIGFGAAAGWGAGGNEWVSCVSLVSRVPWRIRTICA
eukprot:scaffold48_cov311-Pinguiococcus_pyrenoidosus.AAC.189